MTRVLPNRPFRAMVTGLLLWFTGMVVGCVVFAVPSLKAAPAVPYLTANPYITVPIVSLWAPLAWLLVRRCIPRSADPDAEGLRVGLALFAANALLDLVIVVGAMHAGARFYSYAGLWTAYATLVAVPWLVGRKASKARQS